MNPMPRQHRPLQLSNDLFTAIVLAAGMLGLIAFSLACGSYSDRHPHSTIWVSLGAVAGILAVGGMAGWMLSWLDDRGSVRIARTLALATAMFALLGMLAIRLG